MTLLVGVFPGDQTPVSTAWRWAPCGPYGGPFGVPGWARCLCWQTQIPAPPRGASRVPPGAGALCPCSCPWLPGVCLLFSPQEPAARRRALSSTPHGLCANGGYRLHLPAPHPHEWPSGVLFPPVHRAVSKWGWGCLFLMRGV